jgi:hypothetical protein
MFGAVQHRVEIRRPIGPKLAPCPQFQCIWAGVVNWHHKKMAPPGGQEAPCHHVVGLQNVGLAGNATNLGVSRPTSVIRRIRCGAVRDLSRNQPGISPDRRFNCRTHIGILLEENLGIITALANTLATVRVP